MSNPAIQEVRSRFEAEAAAVLAAGADAPEVDGLRVRFLGKKGAVTGLMKLIGGLASEEKRSFGQEVNALKGEVSGKIEVLKAQAASQAEASALQAGWLDATLPTIRPEDLGLPPVGRLHPITLLLEEVIDHFRGLGFRVASGPEIEDEWHNFDALNIPKDHPARDVWDTFYTTEGEVPRTHTSSVQARTMKTVEPPLRIIAPGKCFRNETVDATHLACFNQVEGLLVDKHVTIGHLKAMLEGLVERLMGRKVPTRFRPAFYPFVEPGLDLDIQCFFCEGEGTRVSGGACPVCKGKKWIEVIPCGLVHPNVFRSCGHDPDEWQGFAFGMGFDRMVMMRYGIDDLRRMYEGRLDLVRQF